MDISKFKIQNQNSKQNQNIQNWILLFWESFFNSSDFIDESFEESNKNFKNVQDTKNYSDYDEHNDIQFVDTASINEEQITSENDNFEN